LNDARLLLENEMPGLSLMNPGLNTTFITAVSPQQGYFDTVTQGFALEPLSAGATVQNYSAAAAAATIAGFNEQLVGFQE
jgi:hypothetical protein